MPGAFDFRAQTSNITPKNLVNLSSSGVTGGASTRSDISATTANARAVLCGALTASTLKTILNVSGSGIIFWLGSWATDATSRTLRARLTLDGVVVYDSSSTALGALGAGSIVIGGGATSAALLSAVPFKLSMLFEVSSSITETDKFGIGFNYSTN